MLKNNNTYKILAVLLAGLMPLILCIHNIVDYIYWIIYDDYLYNWFVKLIDVSLLFIIFTLVVSVVNNYCIYHSAGILSVIIQRAMSLSHEHLMIFGNYLAYNLVILALNVFSLVMLIIVLIHIAKQIKQHYKKLNILLIIIKNEYHKRVSRPSKIN